MRVVEVFGPTIQGEGPHAGRVTHFVRFGGCDYRCSWCDSMHAVDPAQVRQAPNMDEEQIMLALADLRPAPMLVLSGGNPALQRLRPLVGMLRHLYDVIAVETQGSVWADWLRFVDSLVVSPKPPSSGMVSERHDLQLEYFMGRAREHLGTALKVVVFDSDDLRWAGDVHEAYPSIPFFVSAGTDVGVTDAEVRDIVGDRYGWLCDAVAHDDRLRRRAVVLPQLHVVAWGTAVGV